MYMIWWPFYSNETVKCSWSNSQSSSGDVVHVLMSSFSETADAENATSILFLYWMHWSQFLNPPDKYSLHNVLESVMKGGREREIFVCWSVGLSREECVLFPSNINIHQSKMEACDGFFFYCYYFMNIYIYLGYAFSSNLRLASGRW